MQGRCRKQSTWTEIHRGKVNKTQLQHMRVITGGRKTKTRGDSVRKDKASEIKQEITRQNLRGWQTCSDIVCNVTSKRSKYLIYKQHTLMRGKLNTSGPHSASLLGWSCCSS